MPLAVVAVEQQNQVACIAGGGMTTAGSGMGPRRIARPPSGLAGTGSLTSKHVVKSKFFFGVGREAGHIFRV
jgi:hypothetical protein